MVKLYESSRKRIILTVLIVALIICIAILSILVTLKTINNSISLKTTPNCSSSAVIKCGSPSTANLKTAYQKSSYAQAIYKYFSITSTDIADLNKTAVVGSVSQNGDVYIKGDSSAVATNALVAVKTTKTTSGATNYNGQYFILESPSNVFTASSEPAFVVMKNTAFSYAILADGDNPVIGSGITALSSQTPKISTQKSSAAPSSSSTSSSSSSTKASSPTSSSSSSSSSVKSTPTQPLTNTGPATDITVTLFIVVSATGALLYRKHIIRRAHP